MIINEYMDDDNNNNNKIRKEIEIYERNVKKERKNKMKE